MLSATLIACIIVESTFRVFDIFSPSTDYFIPDSGSPTTLLEYDPVLGWKGTPNARGIWGLKNWFEVPVAFNSLGFRDREHPSSSNSFRVVVLGDSYSMGFRVRQEDLYATILDQTPGMDVVNLGITGYGTDQELLALKEYGLRYKPDLVILQFFSSNDVYESSQSETYGRNKPYFTDERELTLHNVPVPRKPALTEFFDQLRTRQMLKQTLGSYWERLSNRLFQTRAREERETDRRTSETIPLVQRMVREIADISKRNGAEFLIVLTPGGEVHPGLPHPKFSVPFPNSNVLDLRPAFEESVAKGGQPVFAHPDFHWTAEGNRIAAGEIRHWIEQRGLLNRR